VKLFARLFDVPRRRGVTAAAAMPLPRLAR